MTDIIAVDSDGVQLAAEAIHKENVECHDILMQAQIAIRNLGNPDGGWKSKSADIAIKEFESFATLYFQQYFENIYDYTQFLLKNVSESYALTDANNRSYADLFK
ncbi:MAG: hypothetical protein FWG40_12060 [Peptococcaceae bacterium]|nr:hypothetical protein [Peptococcaceae bacterium]